MKNKKTINDVQALVFGLIFSFLFTLVIAWTGQFIDNSGFALDQGASWYFWKLPNPTFWTRFSVWILYLGHQISFWAVFYLAQKNKTKVQSKMNSYAWWAFGVNAIFILLHFLQTHLFYDGLAQDVSIWSSQVSVIIMLVLILLMENRRRGLFWGKKVKFSREIINFVRRYHGYYIGWAIIYTFWYHPMESSIAHLMGFFYIFILLLQGSLMYTRIHTRPWWTTFLEFFVTIHGTAVALMQGNGMWAMFFFGFFGIFVITQQHGLKLPKWTRWVVLGAYLIGVVVVYNRVGYGRLYELVSIPLIEYASVFIAAVISFIFLIITEKETTLFQKPENK